LTSRIHHNFGEKKTPREREREREEYEREKKKEKSARCDFYYRVVDLVVVVVSSSFVFFPLRFASSSFVNETNARIKTDDDEKSFQLVVAFSRIFSPQKEKKNKGRTG